VVNIYSKCDLHGKRRLWENLLMSKGGFGRGAWCVVGDWNAVLHREERRERKAFFLTSFGDS
jgi:hypothetical protein